MKVLITGALGRVGVMVVEEALAKGFEVRATDLDTPKNRETGAAFAKRGAEVHYGNLLDEAFLKNLLQGVDAVMHNAAMLPPHTETKPEIAHKVNVGVTKKITELVAQMSPMPRLIFPSSFTVFGQAKTADSFKAVDDALARVRTHAPRATVLYTRGADGMTALPPDGGRIEQPAFAVAVADTVGAGDACIGGFLASRLQAPGASLETHVRFAAATAAAACTRPGAHAPSRAEVEALLP